MRPGRVDRAAVFGPVSGTVRMSRGLRMATALSGTGYLSDGDLRTWRVPDWVGHAAAATHRLVLRPSEDERLLHDLEADRELRAALVTAWDLAPDGSQRGDAFTATVGPNDRLRKEAVLLVLRAACPWLPPAPGEDPSRPF